MNKTENSYRSILKGTSIFGGIQIFQILINLIRGKFVAMFLGPEGMGVSSLFTSSANTITQFSSLGLNLAFVKEVSQHREHPAKLSEVTRVALTLIQFTALAGALICVLISPWLSTLSFGSDAYSWQFMLLGVMIYFSVAGAGKLSLLQGLHRVRILSVSSLIGAVIGLITGVPLYYFFGTKGIVPAMIILSLSTFTCYTVGLRRVLPRNRTRFSWESHKPIVKRIVSLGIILMASALINSACIYGINIFIRSFGTLEDVGLFNAANSITNQYAGVVFTAMSLDYFPRLSAAASDTLRMKGIVNRQLEIVALIICPAAILIIATTPILIRLLLTDSFLGITSLMRWMGLGVLFKAISFPMGYIAFAKNNRRLFFWLEGIVCNALYIGLSILFYYYFGLMGLGYSMVVEHFTCCLLYLAVNNRVYSYSLSRKALLSILYAIAGGTAVFLCSMIPGEMLSYYLMAMLFIAFSAASYLRLRKLMKSDADR